MAEFDRPVGIGSLITADTTAPLNIPALASTVRAALGDPRS
jgi:hypothetical protein